MALMYNYFHVEKIQYFCRAHKNVIFEQKGTVRVKISNTVISQAVDLTILTTNIGIFRNNCLVYGYVLPC